MIDRRELEKLFKSIDWGEYRRYLLRKNYSRGHIRNMFYYGRKYALEVLLDPTFLSGLSRKTAEHVLNALSLLVDYLDERMGVELVVNWRKLRKYLPPKKEDIDIFEYVERFGGRLIDAAMDQLIWNPNLRGFYVLPALLAFFTGLRGTEIRFLIMNVDRLRSMSYGSSVAVELNFHRRKKKAWLTILPEELYRFLSPVYIGVSIDKRLRERGVYLSLMRKVHRSILSRTMDDAMIDLLQGRAPKIIVKHYTKDLLDIVERYEKAYKPYYKIIDVAMRRYMPKRNSGEGHNPGGGRKFFMGPPAGFEPATSGYLQQ